ncbi:MAG: NlpC/P60 family protein, partial [Thermoplasmata archaeon]|nr:NlpC/P60 family protein [Thermoplasmata archaeon]
AGIAIDHSAYYQYRESTPISLAQLEPGDLLFYFFPDDGSDPVTHVAMYVGNNTVIQAPETGEVVSYHPLYLGGLVGAGRP